MKFFSLNFSSNINFSPTFFLNKNFHSMFFLQLWTFFQMFFPQIWTSILGSPSKDKYITSGNVVGAGSSVRIRIGGSARSPTFNQDTAWQENLINKFSVSTFISFSLLDGSDIFIIKKTYIFDCNAIWNIHTESARIFKIDSSKLRVKRL